MQPGNEVGGQQGRSFIDAARRSQIIRAAIETIAEVGYAKASFARIARRAGISAGLISYHFAGKDELIGQIVHEVNTSMDRALEQRADGADSYRATLRALIEGFVRYCADHPTELLAAHEIETARDQAANGGGDDATLAELEDMLRAGQDAGEFRDFSPRLMAVTLTGVFEVVPRELFARPDTDVDAFADELATTFEAATDRATSTPPRG